MKLLKAESIEELETAFKEDGNYMKAVNKIEELLMDPKFAGAYDVEERRAFDMEDMRLTGIDEGMSKGKAIGLTEGKAIGLNEGKRKIAKNMLNKNMNVSIISELTGLSIEEIKEIEK